MTVAVPGSIGVHARRRILLIDLLVVAGVAACGTNPATPPPLSVAPSASPAARVGSTPSHAAGTPAAFSIGLPNGVDPRPSPWPLVTFRADLVKSVELLQTVKLERQTVRPARLASWGPRAVFTDHLGDEGPFGSTIFMADVETGSFTELLTPDPGWHVFEPVIAGQTVAWIQESSTGWRLQVRDPSGAVRTLDSGRGPTREVVRMDMASGLIAYGIPGSPQKPDTIVVRRLADGSLVRRIDVPERAHLYKLALDRGDVFFSAGAINGDVMFRRSNAWLAVEGTSEPRLVASDAYELALADGTLAYVWDPKGDTEWTVVVRDAQTQKPMLATPDPHTDASILRSRWPAAGDGLACWVPEWARLRSHLSIWSRAVGAALNIDGAQASQCGLGGGWLTWSDSGNGTAEPAAIRGIAVSDLARAFAALATTP